MKAWLNAHKSFTMPQQQQGGWMPRGQLSDLNAMDTSIGRLRGQIMGSEEINFHTPTYSPRGGFLL